MKYIKVFEEFFGGYDSLENKDKIEDLIELCFAELTDEDFRVAISEKNISIGRANWNIDKDRLFNYTDVKDHLITFVKLLSKDYDVDHIFFMGDWKKKSWLDKKIDKFRAPSGSRERKEVSVDDLISDKTKINFQVISITIKIK